MSGLEAPEIDALREKLRLEKRPYLIEFFSSQRQRGPLFFRSARSVGKDDAKAQIPIGRRRAKKRLEVARSARMARLWRSGGVQCKSRARKILGNIRGIQRLLIPRACKPAPGDEAVRELVSVGRVGDGSRVVKAKRDLFLRRSWARKRDFRRAPMRS